MIPDGGVTVFASAEEFVAAAKEHIAIGESSRTTHSSSCTATTSNLTMPRSAPRRYHSTSATACDEPFGTAFVYSWPSKGAMLDYGYDADSARLAKKHLAAFVQLILDKTGAKNIHLIAHSMGNRPLVDVLGEMANNHTGPKRINEIILPAPDIDAGEFKTVAKSIGDIAHGVTLYASSNDRAMLASRTAHGEALRAGDVSASGPVIIKGIQSLDVSALNTDILALNHSTYADSKELLDDIWKLMRTGARPPNARTLLLRAKGTGSDRCWRSEE